MTVDPDTTRPQRSSLQFCKAFFEVLEPEALAPRLEQIGAQQLAAEKDRALYVWHCKVRQTLAGFLVRTRGSGLVLEGPSPTAVGAAWRRLDADLAPVARARVAAGDRLDRFLPRPRPQAADRPESFSREHERRVLAEFHTTLYARWADTPQSRLDGLTPRQAAASPAAQHLLAGLLDRMRRVEEERRARGIPAISVAALEQTLFA